MGKSSASCFKIIACGGDSVEHDDLGDSAENKTSSGRGWSFRKRSARHRVLNSVISETPTYVNKESPEATAVNFQALTNTNLLEKTSVIQWTEEKTKLPSQLEPKVSDDRVAGEYDITANAALDESSIIIIQASVRGFLARKELLKQKNIIKLQSIVRGHLVRSHAVGTLLCVQAIIKMQALVRARLARLREENSGFSDSRLLTKNEATRPNKTYAYISTKTLLSNRFARQLMESSARTKPITIKCDPLKSDSVWKWLERWMSVSSLSNEEPQETGKIAQQQDKEPLEHDDSQNNILVPSDCSESTNIKSALVASTEASENDGSLITENIINLYPHASQLITLAPSHVEVQKIEESISTRDIIKFVPCEIKQSEYLFKVEQKSPLDEEETGKEQGQPDMERISIEHSEADAKKISRQASPSFIAAQSKFEELSLTATSGKLTYSFNQDPRVESSLDKAAPSCDQPIRSSEVGLVDKSLSHASTIQVVGFERGTDLSISSTPDSPTRSEVGNNELEQDKKNTDEVFSPRNADNVVFEDEGISSVTGIYPSHANMDQFEQYESANSALGASATSLVAEESSQLETKPEADPHDVHLERVSEPSLLKCKSSPEASSQSHTTVPESQATSLSQVSVKPKKSKGNKRNSGRQNSSSSTDKKSISNHNQDSAARSSMEQLLEYKSGKRRNSFGSAKSDHETRDSSSSNLLPSYMQATESARAKAITNGSPRSSPDVYDKDIYIKKSHSLPGTSGRQGSPRMQRSLSQAQQNAKANGTQSPQDFFQLGNGRGEKPISWEQI